MYPAAARRPGCQVASRPTQWISTWSFMSPWLPRSAVWSKSKPWCRFVVQPFRESPSRHLLMAHQFDHVWTRKSVLLLWEVIDFRNKEVEFTFRVQPTLVQVPLTLGWQHHAGSGFYGESRLTDSFPLWRLNDQYFCTWVFGTKIIISFGTL